MKSTLAIQLQSRETIKSVLFDVAALLFIFLIPAISHMLKLPVYFIEPMRLALVLVLLHTTKRNAYVIALALPVFSFMISAHPVVPKMMLITAELVLNVFLFYYFARRLKSVPAAIFTSILASKLFYYMVKFLLVNTAILSTGLVGIPVYMQIIMTVLFTAYAMLIVRTKMMNQS